MRQASSTQYDGHWRLTRALSDRPDDLIVTVIEDGKQSVYWDYAEHNVKRRKWWVRVGRVREG
jgi:hypothetical protein